ncbi:CpaD family pilus assembly protein [Alteraurantiacibacter aquimixticola]|uniref:Pilus assembly protein CpaD n=1 Tax=Alteraurantiacibacter aquimixticola TaxID=2489173 RepID=A0A4T3F6M0_9SPHN|nr:CpaD family pilus assembly protein [Alteraurantiacibacter aquimixticola]TIX51322.1 pilus assembly protein CpaD [Alteraurantiacibacter aquimixticola]
MTLRIKRAAATALALSLAAGLGACTTPAPANSSLYSVNQPVVERSNFTLDLRAGASGLTVPEQARLADWFETLDVGYGDRISLDDPMASAAVKDDVAAVASRFSLLLEEAAPVTVGYIDPGNIRVVVTRSTAHVPDCPNWSGNANSNLGNNTSANFGCAINSNLAAMVADPEHLLEGAAGTGDTVVMSSTKAIESYREAAPTGGGGTAVSAVATN